MKIAKKVTTSPVLSKAKRSQEIDSRHQGTSSPTQNAQAEFQHSTQAAPTAVIGDAHATMGGVHIRLPQTRAEGLTAADEMALNVLEKLLLDEPTAKKELSTWVQRIEGRQNQGQPLTVIEHTASLYIFKSGLFEGDLLDAETKTSLKSSLQKSHAQLTGKAAGSDDELIERLPRSVLKKADRKARLYHAAAFQSLEGSEAQGLADSSFFRNFYPEKQDYAAAALLGLAFATAGAPLLAGAATGYLALTLTESFFHKHIAHSDDKIRKFVGRLRKKKAVAKWLGDGLHRAFTGHAVVHHHMTFKESYTEQFANEEARRALDEKLDRMPGDIGEHMRDSDYGLSLNTEGLVNFITTLAPTYPAMMAAMAGIGGPAAIVGMLAVAPLYPLASKTLHPHLHKKEEDALKNAGPLLSRILDSRIGRFISRQHFVHHDGRGAAYNLLPGGDIILGEFMEPNLKDLLQMRKEGILM